MVFKSDCVNNTLITDFCLSNEAYNPVYICHIPTVLNGHFHTALIFIIHYLNFDLLALLCVMFSCVLSFSHIVSWVRYSYLIVSVPYLCLLPYFDTLSTAQT